MLVPFEKNHLLKLDLSGFYLSSFINDTLKFEENITGLMILIADDLTGYLLFSNGSPLFFKCLANNSGNEWPQEYGCEILFSLKSVDIYVNTIKDHGMFNALNLFFNSPTAFMVSSETSDIKRMTGIISAQKESGVLGFKNGAILNLATVKNGIPESLYFYLPDKKRYASEKDPSIFNAVIASVDKLKPFVVFRRYVNVHDHNEFLIKMLNESDVIKKMIESYTVIFETIYRVFKMALSIEKTSEISEKIFTFLRGKYDPLYSTVGYSKESGKVNWEAIAEERKYIASDYRYEKYHLYLDELLRLLLKVSQSVLDPETNKKMVLLIREKNNPDKKNDTVLKEIANRVDKMLEKVKY